MDKKTDKFTMYCNECDWKETTKGLPYHFCPKCGHVNIGFSLAKINNATSTLRDIDKAIEIRENNQN